MKVSSQLESSGVLAIVHLGETGETFHIFFKKGETKKKVSVDIGGNLTHGFIHLRPVKTSGYDDIDMELSLTVPSFEGDANVILEKEHIKSKDPINTEIPPYADLKNEDVKKPEEIFTKEMEQELAPNKEADLVFTSEDEVRVQEEDHEAEKKRRRRR